jgi:TetR/AcrR family transcriptional regulator, regulator of cefoperazone and chloramphenicol sensitivity
MTTSAATSPAFDDLTARARIRDAAIRLFTEQGEDGTTILDIAAAAGVSGGLIRHHFRSKDGLRAACDAYVLAELLRFKAQVVDTASAADPGVMPTFDARQILFRRYLGRALIDGSTAAAARFGEIVDLTEQWFVDQDDIDLPDPRASAAALAAMQVGLLVMHDHVSQTLGADRLSADTHLRIALAAADLFARPLVRPEFVDRARSAFTERASTTGGLA